MKKMLLSLLVIWLIALLGVTGLFWLNQSMKQRINTQVYSVDISCMNEIEYLRCNKY